MAEFFFRNDTTRKTIVQILKDHGGRLTFADIEAATRALHPTIGAHGIRQLRGAMRCEKFSDDPRYRQDGEYYVLLSEQERKALRQAAREKERQADREEERQAESPNTNTDMDTESENGSTTELCHKFMDITGLAYDVAEDFLAGSKWNLQAALDNYFSVGGNGNVVGAAAQPLEMPTENSNGEIRATVPKNFRPPQMEQSIPATAPKQIPKQVIFGKQQVKLMTWNIEINGQDVNGIKTWAKAVADIVLKEMPTVVFMQGVVNASLGILETNLKNDYLIVKCRGLSPSFCVTMLKKTDAELDGRPQMIGLDKPYLKTEVKLFGHQCVLVNSHLKASIDRIGQLRAYFDMLAKHIPDMMTAIVGGDLNLRGNETAQIGDLPLDMKDLWNECPSQNPTDDNAASLPTSSLFQFSRLFYRSTVAWKPKMIYPLGADKIEGADRFPGASRGIVCCIEMGGYA